MNWMLLPLKRYFDFSGRSRRLEYWLFTAFVWGIFIAEFFIGRQVTDAFGIVASNGGPADAVLLIIVLTWLGTFIPWLAALIRRLHDSDKSGLWLLIYFLPFGPLVLLVFLCLDGTEGPNSYGENPKDDATAWHADVFA
jgi:uncharacterized membrane protein YhaH (DUF805 family)